MKIPQELVVVIFVGGIIVFFLFVIFSGRKNNSKDPDNNKKSNSKCFFEGKGKAMDRDKIIFYAVLGTVVVYCFYCSIYRLEKRKKGREGE